MERPIKKLRADHPHGYIVIVGSEQIDVVFPTRIDAEIEIGKKLTAAVDFETATLCEAVPRVNDKPALGFAVASYMRTQSGSFIGHVREHRASRPSHTRR